MEIQIHLLQTYIIRFYLFLRFHLENRAPPLIQIRIAFNIGTVDWICFVESIPLIAELFELESSDG